MGYALYLGKQCVDGWLVGRRGGGETQTSKHEYAKTGELGV